MFGRILDYKVKSEKKEEFVRVVKNEVLPVLWAGRISRSPALLPRKD
jgi:hypothetical protein